MSRRMWVVPPDSDYGHWRIVAESLYDRFRVVYLSGTYTSYRSAVKQIARWEERQNSHEAIELEEAAG